MAFFAQTGPQGYGPLLAALGGRLGSGIGQGLAGQQQQRGQQQQSGILSQILTGGDISADELAGLPPQLQLEVAKMNAQQQGAQQKQSQALLQGLEKQQLEGQESAILAKFQSGQQLTQQEMSQLSPTSLRTLIGQQKEAFEPESQKLEAKRVAELATQIENDYQAYNAEEQRLSRMEKLSEADKLSTPAFVKALDTLGIPLSVLSNPESEEFKKLEADYLRDVRQLFPGRVTNFEVQAFLKSIPTLHNSKEGRKAIIRNRKLLNEAKKVRYDAYRDVLKEYGGRKPPNMGILIDEKIGPRMDEIAFQFKNGIGDVRDRALPSFNVRSPDGRILSIPQSNIKSALEAGGQIL